MRVSLEEQLACVRREINQRKRVYPRWVADGKMTKQFADDQLAAMEAVLETVETAAQGERLL